MQYCPPICLLRTLRSMPPFISDSRVHTYLLSISISSSYFNLMYSVNVYGWLLLGPSIACSITISYYYFLHTSLSHVFPMFCNINMYTYMLHSTYICIYLNDTHFSPWNNLVHPGTFTPRPTETFLYFKCILHAAIQMKVKS